MISASIKGPQFPLALARASIFHKAQGLSLDQGVVDFGLKKQVFGSGQIYTALIRIKWYNKLLWTGEYKRSSIKINMEALNEYE